MLAVGLLLALPVCAQAGQDTTPENQPDLLADLLASRQREHASRLPDPTEAMDAYAAADTWLRGWAEPDTFATPAAAARVRIAQRGVVVGEASVQARDAGDAGPLTAAMAEAMDQARRVLAPRGGALGDELLRELAADLTLSVELAGPMTPMSRNELVSPDAMILPGLTGVAARFKEQWEQTFPVELASSGTAPSVQLGAMAASLLGDPAQGIEMLIDLASTPDLGFYRFEAVHIANVGPEGAPVFLSRGNRVIERGEITTASLVRFAEDLVGHVDAARFERETKLGLMGPINITRGVPEPELASPTQQALVAYALTRIAETPRIPEATRTRASTLAREIVTDLADVEAGEVAPADDGIAAAILWVVLDSLGAEFVADTPALADLQRTCESMLTTHAEAIPAPKRGTVSEAVLTWVFAERAARTGADREFAERELRALHRGTPQGGMVGLMPWIGWAELALAGDEGPIPAAVALREARDVVWTHQLTQEDTGTAERDLQGGIIFTTGGVSLPTWNTARPVALMATMLADPRLTTAEEMPGEVVRLIDAMRFLRQLAAGPGACAFSPRPGLACGGVRTAVWDQREPPEATALTMLAVSELLRSLDTLEQAAREAREDAKKRDIDGVNRP